VNQTAKDFFRVFERAERDPEYLLILAEELELARRAASRQGPFYSLFFCLRFEEELEPKEIAQILGVSLNYVNVYTHKLRKKIKHELRG